MADALTALHFKPTQRLLTKPEFDRVYQLGIRVADPLLTLHAYRHSSNARLGMSVSTKNSGSSVRRNQLRRWIREDFRIRQNRLLSADWVITIRANAKAVAHPELNRVLERLYTQMTQRLLKQPVSNSSIDRPSASPV